MKHILAKDTKGAISILNRLRRDHANKWVMANVVIDGVTYYVKFYGTWIQVAKGPSGINYSSTMQCKVAEFKETLKQCFSS